MACAAGLLLGMTTGPIATASIPQDDVVSDVPALNTPQLVPSAGIDRPRANAVARLNGRVYVGGLFAAASDRDSSRTDLQNLFAFSDPAYQLDGGFNARANGEVFALDTGNDALYVGGGFRTVNGRVTGPLAKLDPATGAVDTGFNPPFTTGAVNQVILKNGVLYVGGTFPGHLLALNPDTGANTGDINFTVSSRSPTPSARSRSSSSRSRTPATGWWRPATSSRSTVRHARGCSSPTSTRRPAT